MNATTLKNVQGSLDLNAIANTACEAAGIDLSSPDLATLVERTAVYLETTTDIQGVPLPQSHEMLSTYIAFLDAFRLELLMAELWDLHQVIRGSTQPFAVARAASKASDTLDGLIHRCMSLAHNN
ncbi:hypothetical protein [Shinella sp.]|uniref:hypothetical protein n=1 Tax=Shinella sp. TaxID=1870904 RepID=UPI00289EE700|nr:hypothetical protein [Shinella sp.]